MRLVQLWVWCGVLLLLVIGIVRAQKPVSSPELGFRCVLPKGYKDIRAQVKKIQAKRPPKPGQKEVTPQLALVRNLGAGRFAVISVLTSPTRARKLKATLPADAVLLRGNKGRVLNKKRTTVDGTPALRYTVQVTDSKGSVIRHHVDIVRQGRVYQFFFVAPPSLFETVARDNDAFIASVKWLSSSP